MKLLIPSIFLLLFACSAIGQKPAVLPYATGIPNPIDLKHCGDDRLFAVDRAGRIFVINPDASVRPTPFLDIRSKISSTSNEEGLLGLAFSPDYSTSGRFYVNYTSNAGGQLHTVVEQYQVSSDPNIADPASAIKVLTQNQPYGNHNGGNMMFGPDGLLYINLGDGGSGGDPHNNGQNLNTFLGKILRIDVSVLTDLSPYRIPTSNPFYSSEDPNVKKEIWAYGLRNPWRSSFDRLTGDLWIADVGQSAVEEINFQPAGDDGGHNYGWNIMEGDQCYNPPTGCNSTGLSMPIFTYTHATGKSITGGYVYRGVESKSLFGTYIFADFMSKWVDGIKQKSGALEGAVQRLVASSGMPGNPTSFGEDRYGELYMIMNGNTTIFKFTDTSYLRRPKAHFTVAAQQGETFVLSGLQGRSLTYQWQADGNDIPGATSANFTATEPGTYTLVVTNSIGNSDTSEAFVLGPLPVQIGTLQATQQNKKVLLQWNTFTESNLAGFAIEKKSATDPSFKEVGFVLSKSINGNSNHELHYSFADDLGSQAGAWLYRVKAVDQDGKHSYSNIVSIQANPVRAIRVFPNPTTDLVTIEVSPQTLPVILTVFDGQGRKVRSEVLTGKTNLVSLAGMKGACHISITTKNDGRLLHRETVIIK